MSYDIYVQCSDPCPHCDTGGSFNITYNVARMWEAATGQPSLRDLSGDNARALELVNLAIAKFTDRPETYRMFEAPNGWGTLDQFLDFLRRLRVALEDDKEGKIDVH